MRKYAGLIAIAICVTISTGVSGAIANTPLYENYNVLGVLDCNVDGDLRLIAGSMHQLRCDYRPREDEDSLFQYRGSVKMLADNVSATGSDIACWTVIQLLKPDTRPIESTAVSLNGFYSKAMESVTSEYELKPTTLVGGPGKSIALESRCDPTQPGNNVADFITGFELSR